MEVPQSVRSKYGDQGRCFVAGLEVSPEQLTVRSMNFGQHWRTAGIVDVEYSVALPIRFVHDFLRAQLPEFIDDAIKFPDLQHEVELERQLRLHDWPAIDAIFADPEVSTLSVMWYARELLIEWLTDGAPQASPGFVLNTVAGTTSDSRHVTIVGTARRDDLTVQFQDV